MNFFYNIKEKIINLLINLFKLKNKAELKFIIFYYFVNIKLILYSFFFKKKLSIFFQICNSDKSNQYAEQYDLISNIIFEKKLKILEIGIGGHNVEFAGGQSLIALARYFNKSHIIGADFFKKDFLDRGNITTVLLDQGNPKMLKNLGKKYGPFDLIIDDGSHFADHQRLTFSILFDFLKNNGIYIIEDMAGSYERALNGDPDLSINKNNITYFSSLTHSVNSHILYKKNYDKLKKFININRIFFLPKMIVVEKFIKRHPIVSKKYLEISLDKYASGKKTKQGFLNLKNE
jgi:hypothetical protein